ncbi:hypothetical protein CJ030_MR0G005316 [Morella rubra]|uniref:Endonuclease/exonuclease/phosphatase domain-containing protein n=1 Tax=Morella rubra TaxID=262757 RepID=A0A6A1UL62_9ROSI|nr:hypothetical protein CJ030_MR0G005316 [Morella rubra]
MSPENKRVVSFSRSPIRLSSHEQSLSELDKAELEEHITLAALKARPQCIAVRKHQSPRHGCGPLTTLWGPMRGLYWNCREIGRAAAIRELQSLARKFALDFLCLSETKVTNIHGPLQRAGFFHFVDYPPEGHRGGIVFAWKNSVDVELVAINQNSISLLVYSDPLNTPWLISCVYGPTRCTLRKHFGIV